MKWWIAGASATAVALAVGLLWTHGNGQAEARAASAEKLTERTITATGVSTVRVRPDAVRCTFGVKSTGDSFADVQAQNEKKAKKIADAVTALKIDGLTIRTAPIDVQMQPGFGGPPFGIPGGPPGAGSGAPPGIGVPPGAPPGGPPGGAPKELLSYTVTHSFSVEIKHAEADQLTALADKVLSTAISQGANTGAATDRNSPFGFGQGGPGESGTRVEFFKVDGNAERQKALKQAVAAAVANAKAAAGGADVAIKDIVNLTDQPNSAFGAMFGGPATRADPAGETDVTVTVSVTCTCN